MVFIDYTSKYEQSHICFVRNFIPIYSRSSVLVRVINTIKTAVFLEEILEIDLFSSEWSMVLSINLVLNWI